MPTPSPRGAATNRPETSPKAIVAVLREEANGYRDSATAYRKRASELTALADALEQTGSNPAFQGALTKDDWTERVNRAQLVYGGDHSTPSDFTYMDRALRAAFPELAPSDD